MFDLEKAIADWRKQMLAAGIKSPVPLEELEIHLREDIERRTRNGLDEPAAFGLAVQNVGGPGVLKTEFSKAGGFLGGLGGSKADKTNRIMGALWLAFCGWYFSSIAFSLIGFVFSPRPRFTPDLLLVPVLEFIFWAGIIGSFRLVRGIARDRWIIRVLALLGLVAAVAQLCASQSLSTWGVVLTVFNLATLWLLWPTQETKTATK
jgi:hypothetical protein